MAKKIENSFREIEILNLGGFGTLSKDMQDLFIRLLIKSAIVRSYPKAFGPKGVCVEDQDEILKYLRILWQTPKIKNMRWFDMENDIAEFNKLKELCSKAGWFKSIALRFKINAFYNKKYLLKDTISGLKITCPEAVNSAMETVSDAVEDDSFLNGKDIL